MKSQIGKYRLIEQIGKGGMGEVYLAQNTENGKKVALKILPPELTRNEQYVVRFRREAKVVSQLDHAHIVKVYEVGEQDGIHFIAMEYLAGPSMRTLLQNQERLPLPEAIKAVIDIAYALNFAHSAGIIHRDVKPDNILSDKNGNFKIMDFGIAYMEEGTRLTITGSVVGTPEYMSPEQASGTQVDMRTDIYSLGIVFYELLTGKVPFMANSAAELMQMHLTKLPESAKALNPEIPGNLSTIIGKMLEKKAADRYASFSHMINAVNQALPKNLRTTTDAETIAIETPRKAGTQQKGERTARRERERIVFEIPAYMKIVLALSIILNLAFFSYILFRPAGFDEPVEPMESSFGLRGPMFAPPAVFEETIYVGAEDGTLYACDLRNGTVKWKFKARDKIMAAPVVDGNRVYVGSFDKHVYALDIADGIEKWKINTGDIISAAPVLAEGTLYVCTREGNIFALDTETGREKWSDDSQGRIKHSPSVRHNILFVPSGDNKLLAYNTATGKKVGAFSTNRIKTQAIPIGQKLYYVEFDDTEAQDALRARDITSFTEQFQEDLPEWKIPLTAGP